MRKIRYTLPLLPLKRLSVFPGMILHFDVRRQQSVAAVKNAMNNDKLIFMCFQNNMEQSEPQAEDLAEIGTIAEVHQILNLPDGNIRVLAEGLYRAKITRFDDTDDGVVVSVTRLKDVETEENDIIIEALTRKAMHLVEGFLDLYNRIPEEIVTSLLGIDNPGELADLIAANFPLKPADKQRVLEELDVKARLEMLIGMLSEELEVLSVEKDIGEKANINLTHKKREAILREKAKVISNELGESEDYDEDIQKYREMMEGRDFPKETLDKLGEELERLSKNNVFSQEYSVIQNYIETVLALPWDRKTEDNTDILRAKKILDRDHFGLKKVKERILEYIAVRSLGGSPKNNIICLVGPPGTGKTSIARALAEALDRKYIRISLGGVKNEAEIRGHRKTYVGAMPGRIIDALKRADSSNPLMLFDEIDKMSSDFSSDPASAMLEVFDPEQNKNFRDHYLELPFDLSDTVFIATANTLDTVPAPLLDRMDVIEVEGYTPNEKMNIAKKYLVPKQRAVHGLNSKQLKFSQSAYMPIIDEYTRESGVRELERKIAAICRKTAKMIAEEDADSVSVKKSNIIDILGKPIYLTEKADKDDKVGVVTGLAWTSVGGDTLNIEVNTMPGGGKLELTGNLGDVMKESAKTALSYVRANSMRLGIKKDFYKDTDIHIHVPEGAVPKDGPSAGITITTAIVSALTGRAVKHNVAMTGEVTLRGRVLAIGGLKEKSLAALRFGIKKLIVPYENKKDFDELPEAVKDSISFVFVKNVDAVLDNALVNIIGNEKVSPKSRQYFDLTDYDKVNDEITISENID